MKCRICKTVKLRRYPIKLWKFSEDLIYYDSLLCTRCDYFVTFFYKDIERKQMIGFIHDTKYKYLINWNNK